MKRYLLQLEPRIQEIYERTLAAVGNQPAPEGKLLSIFDVLKAHFLIANHFYLEGEGLGGVGPRDINLLQSAVSRQFVSLGGQLKWTERFDVAATLFYGLITNHAFHDANKRTAFLSVLYFLHSHGWCPSVAQEQFEDFTVEIADRALVKYARYQKLVKERDLDPEVKFISWYLRNNTRKIDRADYVITFRELQTILHRYGFSLSNPSGNHIDLVKRETKPRFFGLLGREEVETRIAQIGFPRWSAEVGKGALKTVREAAKLRDKDGVDSAAFFQGLEPMQSLITTYHQPLMSLANR